MSTTCNIFKIIIALSLAPGNNAGCDVNDWPHSCLSNFRIGQQRCEPCESGTYGCNCSESCPDNTYGPGCYTFCNCPEGVSCDPIVGCGNGTHTSQEDRYNYSARQTILKAQDDIKDTTRQGSNNPANNIDVKTHTTTTQKSDYLWIVIVENCWNFRCNVGANRCPFYLSVYLIQQVITILVCEIKKSLKNFHALKM
ncbi:uncharacterized protein LOC111131605 [Crassostrea virginica]